MNKRILITGVSGFIGRHLSLSLKEKGYFVLGVLRQKTKDDLNIDQCIVEDITKDTDWRQILKDVDIVIHLAARVHVLHDKAVNPLEAFRDVNVRGTERLARQAANAGVKRFIFISSVKVNGEGSTKLYTEQDLPNPEDAYGQTKKEAEDILQRISQESGLKTVILRPVLVYGPRVKANFKDLIKIVRLGFPLPLAGISNKRSYIFIENLTDIITLCMDHPLAIGQTFLVSDQEDVSTSELISKIAKELGKKANLFYLPSFILTIIAYLTGKREVLEKLTGSLAVDSSKLTQVLGWKPCFTMQEGLRKTVKPG